MTTTDTPVVVPVSDEGLREEAMRRLKGRRDFQAHLLAYVLVNTLLWAIWAVTDLGGFPWPIFPTLGWGIGVAFNAWDVYVRRPITESDVERELERLRRKTGS
jgi:hypothetical protein